MKQFPKKNRINIFATGSNRESRKITIDCYLQQPKSFEHKYHKELQRQKNQHHRQHQPKKS